MMRKPGTELPEDSAATSVTWASVVPTDGLGSPTGTAAAELAAVVVTGAGVVTASLGVSVGAAVALVVAAALGVEVTPAEAEVVGVGWWVGVLVP
jgi:hypothetical protein